MRHKPPPGTYRVNIGGVFFDPLIISETGATLRLSPVVNVEWEWMDDPAGPVLIPVPPWNPGIMAFVPPDSVVHFIRIGQHELESRGSYAPI